MALSAAVAYVARPKNSFQNLFYNALGETTDPRDPTGATKIVTLAISGGNTDFATSYIFTPIGGTAGASDTVTLAGPPKSFYTFSVPGGMSPGETYTKLVLGVAKAVSIIGSPTGSPRYILANWSLDPTSNVYNCVIALLV